MNRKQFINNHLYLAVTLISSFILTACVGEEELAPPNDLTFEINEHDTLNIDLALENGSPEGIQYFIQTTATGNLQVQDNSIEYIPAAGYIGTDIFTYVASDGTNESNTATVSIEVAPALLSLSEKPSPVIIESGHSIVPNHATIEWKASTDNTTPDDQIVYEIHSSTTSDFFPTPNTLVHRVYGDTIATLDSLSNNERVFFKIIAVDSDNNRSLETSAIPITITSTPVEIREDSSLFIVNEDIAIESVNAETGIISIQLLNNEAPAPDDFILLDTPNETIIFQIIDTVSPQSAGDKLSITVKQGSLGDLIQNGDMNITTAASDGSSAGSRFTSWEDILWDEMPWTYQTDFDCSDAYDNEADIEIAKDGLPILNLSTGFQIGCDVYVEMSNIYRVSTTASISERPRYLKSGYIEVSGDVRISPYVNMGYEIPFAMPSTTIWRKKEPINKQVTMTVPIPHKVIPSFNFKLNYQLTPQLTWKLKADAGQNIDYILQDILTIEFLEKISYEASNGLPLVGLDFSFDEIREPIITRNPEVLVKSQNNTEFSVTNNFSFGIKVNQETLNRLSITPAINIGMELKGKITDREHYDTLIHYIPDISERELQSVELLIHPKLQTIASFRLGEIKWSEWFESIPDWVPNTQVSIPLIEPLEQTFGEYNVLSTPHLEIDYESTPNKYLFNLEEREDSGINLPPAKDVQWHNLTNEILFELGAALPMLEFTSLESSNYQADGSIIESSINGFIKHFDLDFLYGNIKPLVAASYLPPFTYTSNSNYNDYAKVMTKYTFYGTLLSTLTPDQKSLPCIQNWGEAEPFQVPTFFAEEEIGIHCELETTEESSLINSFPHLITLSLTGSFSDITLNTHPFLRNLGISSYTIDNFYVSDKLQNLTSITLNQVKSLRVLDLSHANSLRSLRVYFEDYESECISMGNLDTIIFPNDSSLTSLRIRGMGISNLDTSKLKNLNTLDLSCNNLFNEPRFNENIESLNLSNNFLSSLSLSNLDKTLSYLNVSNTPITSIDFVNSINSTTGIGLNISNSLVENINLSRYDGRFSDLRFNIQSSHLNSIIASSSIFSSYFQTEAELARRNSLHLSDGSPAFFDDIQQPIIINLIDDMRFDFPERVGRPAQRYYVNKLIVDKAANSGNSIKILDEDIDGDLIPNLCDRFIYYPEPPKPLDEEEAESWVSDRKSSC